VLLRSFASIIPLFSNCTIFTRASGEQRGYGAEISHEHMPCHKHVLVGHSWVGLGPILSYRCRCVIYLTNQVNVSYLAWRRIVDGCMKVGRKDVLYQVSGLPRLTRFSTMLFLDQRLEPILGAIVASARTFISLAGGLYR
jgi:hypothetical protein